MRTTSIATLRLGVELFRQGALDEALVGLERAVALGPKTAEARNNYGVASLPPAARSRRSGNSRRRSLSRRAYAEARLRTWRACSTTAV